MNMKNARIGGHVLYILQKFKVHELGWKIKKKLRGEMEKHLIAQKKKNSNEV